MQKSQYENKLSKQEIVNEISRIALESQPYSLSTGSSIPSAFFQDLENRFSIPRSNGMESKAATFCDYFGVEWTAACDSSETPSGGGGTVTKVGLLVLLSAVKRALERELSDS
nr:hypothetical protein HULAa50H9_00021 [Candidatus Nanopelagicales bacterium]